MFSTNVLCEFLLNHGVQLFRSFDTDPFNDCDLVADGAFAGNHRTYPKCGNQSPLLFWHITYVSRRIASGTGRGLKSQLGRTLDSVVFPYTIPPKTS